MGKKCRETGNAEIKLRASGQVLEVPVEQVVEKVLELKAALMAELQGPYAWEE